MKRILLTVALPLFAILLLISISITFAEKALTQAEKKAEKQLLLTLNIRKEAIETYYGSVQSELLFWAKNKIVVNRLQNKSAIRHKQLAQLINELSTQQAYDNVLLTNPQGKIIYSVNSQISSLPSRLFPLLKQIQQASQTRVYFSDYLPNHSNIQRQTSKQAFVATGIFNQHTLLGILLIQLSTQPLTKLTKPLNGTHSNIQTLVIGNDKQLRNPNIRMTHKIQLSALTDGLLAYGNRHVFTIADQNNKSFLAAFDFAHISKHLTWVIITKSDVEQITKPIKKQIYNWILLGISLLLSALLVGYVSERWLRKKQEEQV